MDISNRGVDDESILASRNYIRWDAEGVEKTPANEEEDIQAVADMINVIQKTQYNNHRHCYSGMTMMPLGLSLRRQLLTTPRHPRSHPRYRQRKTHCS